ncbi:hypothetical protein [Mesorhizobium sp. ANAO-SY3R2]|uniref:hypothetical protein n=1 Tax=Mesorhizobium sp. ANAO-SY3R2 TaxID=3166644 RepID=UPI0036720B08
MTVTNADRAAWAANALEAFRAAHDADGDMQTDIKDLITDLLHLARRECGVEDAGHFAKLSADMHDMEAAEDPEV